MIDKLVRILFLTFFFCKMTKIINFLTNMLVKKKKMCYNEFKLRKHMAFALSLSLSLCKVTDHLVNFVF